MCTLHSPTLPPGGPEGRGVSPALGCGEAALWEGVDVPRNRDKAPSAGGTCRAQQAGDTQPHADCGHRLLRGNCLLRR